LQLAKYRQEQKEIREAFKKIDASAKDLKNLQVAMLGIDEKKLSVDNDKLERRKQWITNLSKDIYIGETCMVINDMIQQGVLVMKN
jgi:hypothetical protein